jgi:Uma2 family endonuclease
MWSRISKDCRAYAGLRIPLIPKSVYAHPDLAIVSGELHFVDIEQDTADNATVCIEVLSPSTKSYDLGEKRQLYCKLPTLRNLLFIEQNKVGIEHWWRDSDGRWRVDEIEDQNAAIRLDSLSIVIPVPEIYAGVNWNQSR